MSWARNKLTQAISEDTQYIGFLCNTGNHWYLAVIDFASGSINIFNSLTGCGNALINSTIKPLMLYASSFEGSQLPMSWETVLQHTKQQTNTSDCGPYANSIHTVYAWDHMLQQDIPSMDKF
jgi:Ulp1 family protease